ncbi:hypothetical protein V1519DRAFT_455522, partial [Lipomyces tetrasporus]
PVYRYIRYNNMLLGLSDPQLSFLGPLFFSIASGMCIVVYYTMDAVLLFVANSAEWFQNLNLTRRLTRSGLLSCFWMEYQGERLYVNNHQVTTGTKAIFTFLTTFILLISVLAYVPYQFAFVVGIITHVNTCIKTLRIHTSMVSLHGVTVRRFDDSNWW